MAESAGSSAIAQLPVKVEAPAVPNWTGARVTRRQWTLIAITGLLNVLFFCSLLCIIIQIYEIASDPDDSTNIASEILILVSALATLAYIGLHSIFSLKQRIWRHQGRLPAKDKKTSYIAVRFGGTLCMLWLLTNGWDMIIVARRPICLPESADLISWEIGKTCQVGRAGIAFAMIALIASCALFGMLATVRRPFESHLLNYKHKPHVPTPTTTPSVSPRQSHSRNTSFTSMRFSRRGVSFSSHRSTLSNVSNTDVDTIDLNSTSAPDGVAAPCPLRSLGVGIFTSPAHPPPVPAAYATSQNGIPPYFQPSLSAPHLPLPPRMSALVSSSGFVPLSIPAQYAASNWKAVHPSASSPLALSASRSQTHVPLTDSSHRFSYRVRHARSSVSLTRPHRLSTSTPADSSTWSTRSGSTSPDKIAESGDMEERRATSGQIAYAILNGTSIPGSTAPHQKPASSKHARHASAPDASAGAQIVRKAVAVAAKTSPAHGKTLVKSSSTSTLGTHHKDSGNANSKPTPVPKDIPSKPSTDVFVPTRRLHSERPPSVPSKPKPKQQPPFAPKQAAAQRNSEVLARRGSTDPRIAAMLSSAVMEKENVGVGVEMGKNKPLPRIGSVAGGGSGLKERPLSGFRGAVNR